jgi:hypothetical protein
MVEQAAGSTRPLWVDFIVMIAAPAATAITPKAASQRMYLMIALVIEPRCMLFSPLGPK